MIAGHMRESMNPKNNEEGANTKAASHSPVAPNMPAYPRVASGETNIPVIGIGIKRSTRRERVYDYNNKNNPKLFCRHGR